MGSGIEARRQQGVGRGAAIAEQSGLTPHGQANGEICRLLRLRRSRRLLLLLLLFLADARVPLLLLLVGAAASLLLVASCRRQLLFFLLLLPLCLCLLPGWRCKSVQLARLSSRPYLCLFALLGCGRLLLLWYVPRSFPLWRCLLDCWRLPSALQRRRVLAGLIAYPAGLPAPVARRLCPFSQLSFQKW